MAKLRWGIIGPGRIAQRFAGAIPFAYGSVLQCVHSSSNQRAVDFSEKYDSRTWTTDLDEFLSDDQIDVVYISNPHNFHFHTVQEVLQAGKPVLCEKPLVVNSHQAKTLIEMAESKQLFLMEAMWSRFLPVWQQVQRWITEGAIGDVQFINSTFGFRIPREPNDRLLNKDLAGGVLLDMGVYNVSLSNFIVNDRPTRIVSDVFIGETGVDERTSVILRYGNKASQFTAGFMTFYENAFSIHGTQGNIFVSPYFWDTTKAVLKPYEGEEIVFDEAWRKNGFEYQIMEVERCLAAGKLQSNINSWDDTLATQQTMDFILESAGISFL